MLTIDVVSETAPPEVNGVAMTVGRLVEGLRARGHRVTLVRPRRSSGDSVGDDITVRGLCLPGYPEVRIGLPAGAFLRRRWRAQRPDVVHVVTEGPLGWSAVRSARSLGIPTTSGFHTNFDRYSIHYGFGWLRPLIAAYLRGLHRQTGATLVPTAALAAELAGEGIPGVRVVGRGVDTDLFNPARRSAELRAAWGVGEQDLVCLYVGRLAAEKNLSLVVRTSSPSWATIHRRGCCGSGTAHHAGCWRSRGCPSCSPGCGAGPTWPPITRAPICSSFRA